MGRFANRPYQGRIQNTPVSSPLFIQGEGLSGVRRAGRDEQLLTHIQHAPLTIKNYSQLAGDDFKPLFALEMGVQRYDRFAF